MGELFIDGNPPVPVLLRRSARARRLSLRVSRLDGRVTLTMPRGVPEREGRAFLRERAEWVRSALEEAGPDRVVGPGTHIPIEGRDVTVTAGAGRAVRLEPGGLIVPGDPARCGARVKGFLKTLARDRLVAASDRYAAALGRRHGRITLRDTRSRWGSCSAQGDLMYSWRLIMAPPEVLHYVAAHEAAHLVEMNHSPAYWAVVERIYPGWGAQRAWLAQHGAELHRVRFAD